MLFLKYEIASLQHVPLEKSGDPADVGICVGGVDVNMCCARHNPHPVFCIIGDSVHLYGFIGRDDRIIFAMNEEYGLL